MIDRLIVASICTWLGVTGLIPDTPKQPLTPSQLQTKAKEASKSAVCNKKKQSKTVKQLCKRWEKQQGVL